MTDAETLVCWCREKARHTEQHAETLRSHIIHNAVALSPATALVIAADLDLAHDRLLEAADQILALQQQLSDAEAARDAFDWQLGQDDAALVRICEKLKIQLDWHCEPFPSEPEVIAAIDTLQQQLAEKDELLQRKTIQVEEWMRMKSDVQDENKWLRQRLGYTDGVLNDGKQLIARAEAAEATVTALRAHLNVPHYQGSPRVGSTLAPSITMVDSAWYKKLRELGALAAPEEPK